MVYWITGRKHSGKTTLAYRISKQTNGVVVDGDHVRSYFPTGYSDEERIENIMRIAKIAKLIEDQGKVAIVACVSPRRAWRKMAQEMFDECIEICLPFGELWENTEFEEPKY